MIAYYTRAYLGLTSHRNAVAALLSAFSPSHRHLLVTTPTSLVTHRKREPVMRLVRLVPNQVWPLIHKWQLSNQAALPIVNNK